MTAILKILILVAVIGGEYLLIIPCEIVVSSKLFFSQLFRRRKLVSKQIPSSWNKINLILMEIFSEGPRNSLYSTCGTSCEETCTYKPEICIAMCKEGCFCIKGFVRDSTGKCILKRKCPKWIIETGWHETNIAKALSFVDRKMLFFWIKRNEVVIIIFTRIFITFSSVVHISYLSHKTIPKDKRNSLRSWKFYNNMLSTKPLFQSFIKAADSAQNIQFIVLHYRENYYSEKWV